MISTVSISQRMRLHAIIRVYVKKGIFSHSFFPSHGPIGHNSQSCLLLESQRKERIEIRESKDGDKRCDRWNELSDKDWHNTSK